VDANPEVKSISFLEDWTEGQQGPALQSRTKDGLTVHLASWTSIELIDVNSSIHLSLKTKTPKHLEDTQNLWLAFKWVSEAQAS